ncbi:BRAP2 RING ZnF UBP domain-containing protein 1 [Impatiens glandulifera]|uniref:BRAP2 RING ZnF UBP domain-containing protein 1 n=1 Tax=Impatiens glandulifera TaxID=253017 RepID=UPI001FB1695C|nr:BRAP2 RING ZnF UBP domain-containing protein 1 [Impatiens glandulifera]
MYRVKIHSVDELRPVSTGVTTTSAAKPAIVLERKGLPHLFRTVPFASSLSHSAPRSTTLIVLAVPNYLSSDDFLLFCGTNLDTLSRVLFIRNDAMEDRYSVLLQFLDQTSADIFYTELNGKRFSPSEAELCHLYFSQCEEFTENDKEAGTPPEGFVELPTCPVCLERLDYDTSGIQTTLCDHSFQCPCVSKWTYLSCQVCRLCHQREDEKPTCAVCMSTNNLWICLICGFVGCGRYRERHAVKHWNDTNHCYSLELSSQQVWDYVGDLYVHRLNQSKVDGKSAISNSECEIHPGECGTCSCNDDTEISETIFNSKVEATLNEYHHVLATQLHTQRRHYELLLVEAKTNKEMRISKEVDRAISSGLQDVQYKLEKATMEKNAALDANRELLKEQESVQNELKEMNNRLISTLTSSKTKELELEEQIRDLKVYIEARKTLANSSEGNDIRGGTVLPVQSNPSNSAPNRRNARSNRRRN